MKIAYVLTSLGIGGAERQALALADRMARRGHAVELLVLSSPLAEEWPTRLKAVYLEMDRGPARILAGMGKARRFLQSFQPDILHSHGFHGNLAARLLRVIVPSVSVVSTIHNVHEGGQGRMLAYRLTDGLTCRTTAVSRAVANQFVGIHAISADKCLVVSNGIDTAEFAPCLERREEVRNSMGIKEGFVWLAAGRIVPGKDYPNLLRTFAIVLAECPKARLWIAGAEVTTREAAGARSLAAELGIDEAVSWLGLRRDLPRLLDAADAFVSASAWEGMPLAVGEAMAMEKPVVATDAGGTSEIAGDAGWIVPCRNPDALSAAMLECMGYNQGMREMRGRAARERIVKLFNVEERADKWEAIYQDALRARHQDGQTRRRGSDPG